MRITTQAMATALLKPKTSEGEAILPAGGNRKGRRNTAYQAVGMKSTVKRTVARSTRRRGVLGVSHPASAEDLMS
jgi:hypothetical protein